MVKYCLSLPVLMLVLAGLSGCSQPSNTAGRDLTQLFSRVWQITDAPSKPAPGSIYTFLPNGTLLETSCVETYRIARWSIDKKAPSVLRILEDGQPAFTAEIIELTSQRLRLRRTLVRSRETSDIKLKVIEQEFVCPDLQK